MKKTRLEHPDQVGPIHRDMAALAEQHPVIWMIQARDRTGPFNLPFHFYPTEAAANAAIEGMNHEYHFTAISMPFNEVPKGARPHIHVMFPYSPPPPPAKRLSPDEMKAILAGCWGTPPKEKKDDPSL